MTVVALSVGRFSPLLFVLEADLLQSVINRMLLDGTLTLPIECDGPDFPIIQYADDTILILPADEAQLIALRDMLHVFAEYTGLRVNFAKSMMVPINVPEAEVVRLSSFSVCPWIFVVHLPWSSFGHNQTHDPGLATFGGFSGEASESQFCYVGSRL